MLFMEALLSNVTTIFTTAIGWAGTVGETIVSTPLLQLFVILPLVGLGIGIFKRLIKM